MGTRTTSALKNLSFTLIALVMTCTLVSTTAYAQKKEKLLPRPAIDFDTSNWSAVKARALREQKPIFVFFYSNGCEHCEREQADVLTNKSIGDYFNAHFVNTKIESSSKTARDFVVRYGIHLYPSFLLFAADSTPMHMETGELPVEDVLTFGSKAYTPNACYFLLKRAYEGGDHSAVTCYNYALAAAYIDRQAASKAAEEYFAKQTDDLTILRNWGLVNKLSFSSDLIGYKMIKQHKAMYAQKYSDTLINRILYEGAYATIMDASRRHDTAMYNTTLGAFNDCKDPGYMFKYITATLYYYNKMYMRDSFVAMTNKYLRTYLWNDPVYLNSTARRLLDITNVASDYPMCETWEKRAMELKKDCAVYETYTIVLMREGRRDEALKMANDGIDFGKTNNCYMQGLLQLRDQLSPPKKQ